MKAWSFQLDWAIIAILILILNNFAAVRAFDIKLENFTSELNRVETLLRVLLKR
jgi:hypothetical protein